MTNVVTYIIPEIIPTGSLARLTPLCGRCQQDMRRETDAFWRGYELGEEAFARRPWWRRLFL